MKKIILLTGLLATAFGCSHQKMANQPSGDIAYGSDATTYQAEYKGKGGLNVGDKVRIMQYDFGDSLKNKQSRTMPLATGKKQIGEATVSNVLNNHYYELKTEQALPIPGNAFIEKF